MADLRGAFNSAILSGGSLLPTVFELLAQEAMTGSLRTASEYILKVRLECGGKLLRAIPPCAVVLYGVIEPV